MDFVYHDRALRASEMRFGLAHTWEHRGLTSAPDDVADTEAMAAVIRITVGNVRLIQRLFTQIKRMLEVNVLQMITKEAVEAVWKQPVIGAI